MTLYVIIGVLTVLAYFFGKLSFKMAEDLGAQKQLDELHRQMLESLKKQGEILAEAKTVDKVIDDLESGRF